MKAILLPIASAIYIWLLCSFLLLSSDTEHNIFNTLLNYVMYPVGIIMMFAYMYRDVVQNTTTNINKVKE